MKTTEQDTYLPLGAIGIDAGPFAFEIRPDGKLLLINKEEEFRYTLHPGHRTGIFDMHKTWKDDKGITRRDTIFAMRWENLIPALHQTSLEYLARYLSILRPVRLGWLRHRGILLLYLFSSSEMDDWDFLVRGKKKRLNFDEDKLLNHVQVIEYYEDILDYPDGSTFYMFRKRKKGLKKFATLYKTSDKNGNPQLFFIKDRDLYRLFIKFNNYMLSEFRKASMPVEEFQKHLLSY